MKVVLDTNIYIALALQGDFTEDLFEGIIKNPEVTIIVSEEIFSEIHRKLKIKFSWIEEDIDLFISKMRKISDVVRITEKVVEITRDPDDNKILECAVSGEADLIVSSDQDLIKLKAFRGIGIVHPKTLSWTLPLK